MSTSTSEYSVHFSHSAYNLAERFAARNTGIPHFQTWNPEDLKARVHETSVLVLSGFWQNELIPLASNLRYVQACAVGYDQFDQQALSKAGVRLSNTHGVNANAVSEHAIALMLGLTRQLHIARDNQRSRHWRPMISDLSKREDELPGKTIAIYGLGTIGKRVAQIAKALGMTTLGIKRDLSTGSEAVDELHGPEAFPNLLSRADFVVLSCPLTDDTTNLMNAEAFASMKPNGYLINVARGGCVDQEALINALQTNRIAGAGIDVTVPEPLPEDSALWAFDNVIITPHTGGETCAYEDNVIDVLIDNLARLGEGSPLRNAVV